jgi:hypothetical protein
MEEKWAKRSSPPPSGVMKPNPLASLNHLTVPVCLLPPSSGTDVSVVSDILTASAQDFTNPWQMTGDAPSTEKILKQLCGYYFSV